MSNSHYDNKKRTSFPIRKVTLQVLQKFRQKAPVDHL